LAIFDDRTRKEKWTERALGVLAIVVLTVLIMLAGRNAATTDQDDPLWFENAR
jgi:hypothetical protein